MQAIVSDCGHARTIRHDVRYALTELADSVEVFKARLAFKSLGVVRQWNATLWR